MKLSTKKKGEKINKKRVAGAVDVLKKRRETQLTKTIESRKNQCQFFLIKKKGGIEPEKKQNKRECINKFCVFLFKKLNFRNVKKERKLCVARRRRRRKRAFFLFSP